MLEPGLLGISSGAPVLHIHRNFRHLQVIMDLPITSSPLLSKSPSVMAKFIH